MAHTRKCTRCGFGTETCIVGSFYQCDRCDIVKKPIPLPGLPEEDEPITDWVWGDETQPGPPIKLTALQAIRLHGNNNATFLYVCQTQSQEMLMRKTVAKHFGATPSGGFYVRLARYGQLRTAVMGCPLAGMGINVILLENLHENLTARLSVQTNDWYDNTVLTRCTPDVIIQKLY